MTESEVNQDNKTQDVTDNASSGFMTGKGIIIAILSFSLVILNYFSSANAYKGVDALIYWLMFGVGAAGVYVVLAYIIYIKFKTNEKTKHLLENILLAIIWLALLGFLDFIGLAYNPLRMEIVNPSGDISLITNDLSPLNSQVSKGFKERDIDIILALMGDKPLPAAVKALEMTIMGIPENSKFEAPVLHQQYHMRLLKMKPTMITFVQPMIDDNEQYYFFGTVKSNESILSLQKVKQGGVTLLISALYEKLGDQWVLNSADLKPYKLGGKSPSEWLSGVQNLIENKMLLPAQSQLTILAKSGIFHPAWFIESQLSTPLKKIALALYEDIMARYQFPIEIETIESKPVVLQIQYLPVKEGGMVPNISVVSQLTALGNEVFENEMKTITTYFSQYFPEIIASTSKVVFTIYASMPIKGEEINPFAQLLISLQQDESGVRPLIVPSVGQP